MSIRFYLQKLVRDKVVRDCLVDPKVLETEYRVLEGLEYRQELAKKVAEEAAEIPIEDDYSRQRALEELADLQNVIDALREEYGVSEGEVREAADRKIAKKGGFAKGHFIEYVTLADDSEWIEVFRDQPDKYREETVQD